MKTKFIFLFIFFILVLEVFAKSAGEFIIEPKVGLNINLTLDYELLNIEAIKFFGAEFYYKPTNRLDTGIGILYNKVETTKNDTPTDPTRKVERMPIYFALKAHLGNNWHINPYVKFIAGYQIILDSDFEGLENGKLYAIGLGLEVINFTLEGSINIEENQGNEEFRGAVGFSLTLGYRFWPI